MAEGLAERTRFALPLTAGVLAVGAVIVGMLRSLASIDPVADIRWFALGSALLVLAIAALTAAVARRWSPRIIAGAATGLLAVAALGLTAWLVYQRGLLTSTAPSLDAVWAGGAFYAALAGTTAVIALAPEFHRVGMRLPWSIVLAFICGIAGAITAIFLAVSGIGLLLAGVITVTLTFMQRRSARRSPPTKMPNIEILEP